MQKRNKSEEIERIKAIRLYYMEKNGWGKTTFVEKLSYTLNAYNRVEERGANTNYLYKLYNAFGVPADYILFGIKSPY